MLCLDVGFIFIILLETVMPESQDLYFPSDLENFQSFSFLLDVYCIFVLHPFFSSLPYFYFAICLFLSVAFWVRSCWLLRTDCEHLFQVCIQYCHVGSLKLAMVGVFAPWKSANPKNQGFAFLQMAGSTAHHVLGLSSSSLIPSTLSNLQMMSNPSVEFSFYFLDYICNFRR